MGRTIDFDFDCLCILVDLFDTGEYFVTFRT